LLLLAFSESNIQLVPDGTLLFHLAVIAVMVGLLNATLLRPISRVLEERERRTRGRLTEAQRILASVAQKVAEYEHRIREARGAGYMLLEEQRSALSREREQKVAEVKTEVAGWLHEQKEKLKTDVEHMQASLEEDARTRALEIGRQILGRPVTVDHLRGIEQR
jgi:F-type H+-transporting ATPase subunit b